MSSFVVHQRESHSDPVHVAFVHVQQLLKRFDGFKENLGSRGQKQGITIVHEPEHVQHESSSIPEIRGWAKEPEGGATTRL